MTGIARELATSQQVLWNNQHALRGAQDGLEGHQLADVPNNAAVIFNELLAPRSTITEVGSANGRDARYWALNGHSVHCLDFSQTALVQLVEHAKRQGVTDRIYPLLFDANAGALPEEVGNINAFYARSALHVDDDTLMDLLGDVDKRLEPDGVVLIEGKSIRDTKIARSNRLGNGLAVDPQENGHLRRVWAPETFETICTTFGWTALRQEIVDEKWAGTNASFVRLIATK